jgi:hypothetical protein
MPIERHRTLSQWLTINSPTFEPALREQIAHAHSAIEEFMPRDQPFIGPALIFAAETGRAVPRKLRMGPFSIADEMPRELADRRHLLTYDELYEYYSRPDVQVLAFFQRSALNYGWSMPSFADVPFVQRTKWAGLFGREFRVVHDGGGFVVTRRVNTMAPRSIFTLPR